MRQNTQKYEYTTVSLDKKGDKHFLKGNLTIKEVTKEVIIPIKILGPFKDPTQKTAVGIKGNLSINRLDHGFGLDRKFENGNFLIGDKVVIMIGLLACKNE